MKTKAFAFAAVLAAVLAPMLAQAAQSSTVPPAQWMSNRTERHDLALRCWKFPGTHDSGAYSFREEYEDQADAGVKEVLNMGSYNWSLGLQTVRSVFEKAIRPAGIEAIKKLAKTQDQTIYQQLQGGVRAFDLRIYLKGPMGNPTLYIHHSLVGPLLSDIFRDIRTFAAQHPGEIIILALSHFHYSKQTGGVSAPAIGAQLTRELGSLLYYKGNSDKAFLDRTYNEVVLPNRSTKVVILDEDDLFKGGERYVWSKRQFWGAVNLPGYEVSPPLSFADTSDVNTMLTKLRGELSKVPRTYDGPLKIWMTLTPQKDETDRIVRTAMFYEAKKYAPMSGGIGGYNPVTDELRSQIMGNRPEWNGPWTSVEELSRKVNNSFGSYLNVINVKSARWFTIEWTDFYERTPVVQRASEVGLGHKSCPSQRK
ncbi:MAG: hypothetical protein HYY78_24065 [Betaproteobacteria bacterium]|nr:hypothetical protein [Betaproteobacteria bacterium]